jgi:tetratricopeptide (TPR) repeat protein
VPIHTYAHALEALGRTQEALEAWDLALRRFPNDLPAQRNRERLQRALSAAATP